jgi:hypothetical protein
MGGFQHPADLLERHELVVDALGCDRVELVDDPQPLRGGIAGLAEAFQNESQIDLCRNKSGRLLQRFQQNRLGRRGIAIVAQQCRVVEACSMQQRVVGVIVYPALVECYVLIPAEI